MADWKLVLALHCGLPANEWNTASCGHPFNPSTKDSACAWATDSSDERAATNAGESDAGLTAINPLYAQYQQLLKAHLSTLRQVFAFPALHVILVQARSAPSVPSSPVSGPLMRMG